jgi:hypothetical protein
MNNHPKFEVYVQPDKARSNLEIFLNNIPEKDADKLLATIKNVQDLGMLTVIRKEWVKR